MDPLRNYTYYLIAGGEIIRSGTFNFPENNKSKTHRFKFMATHDLIPCAYVVVYLTDKDVLFSDCCLVKIEVKLKNFIEIGLNSDVANAEEMVNIKIKTKPKSFVGLLGIDQNILLLKSGNDLSIEEVVEEMELFTEEMSREFNNWSHFRVRYFFLGINFSLNKIN